MSAGAKSVLFTELIINTIININKINTNTHNEMNRDVKIRKAGCPCASLEMGTKSEVHRNISKLNKITDV